MSNVIIPGTETEARAILGSEGAPVPVDFYAVRMMKLDVDAFVGRAGEVGIRSVPTRLVVKDGQVLAARSGTLPSAALAALVGNAVA
ncbi:MAG: hypothetical protein U5L05_04805 [Rubrivivax sp.]|nr:hypothetical protein [Rubrivivax sp.]